MASPSLAPKDPHSPPSLRASPPLPSPVAAIKAAASVPALDKERAGKRRRAANACLRCKSRKQRCDGISLPCKNCDKAGAECIFPEDASGEQFLREYACHACCRNSLWLKFLVRHISILEVRITELTNALNSVCPTHSALAGSPKTASPTPLHVRTGRSTSTRRSSSLNYRNRSTSAHRSPTAQDIMPDLASRANANAQYHPHVSRSGSLNRNVSFGEASYLDKTEEDELVDGIGFLSLTSGAEPLYVGGSSGATWGKIFSSALRRKNRPPMSLVPAPLPSCGSSYTVAERLPQPPFTFPPLPPHDVADALIHTVYLTVQSRWAFMNWPALRLFHSQREVLCGDGTEKEGEGMRTASFFLWIAYALGALLMKGSRRITGLPSHEVYYNAALRYFDHVASSITTIQALLFLAMYSFRSELGLSAWHLGGLAMRMSVELGLHRKTPPNKLRDAFSEETRKRVWWSVYSLDRVMSHQLGRPISIQDCDIDTEYPLDVDCNITNAAVIRARRMALESASAPDALGITSMSSSMHYLRLRRIIGRIKESVYGIPALKADLVRDEILDIMAELSEWRSTAPKLPAPGMPGASEPNEMPLCNESWFELQYYNSLQSLLVPVALKASVDDELFATCTRAAANACDIQRKRLQQGSHTPLSFYGLHKIFMAGLWLLYATGQNPDVIPRSASNKAIRACSNALVIYAAQYETAKTYADCFENLVNDRYDGHDAGAGVTSSAPVVSETTGHAPSVQFACSSNEPVTAGGGIGHSVFLVGQPHSDAAVASGSGPHFIDTANLAVGAQQNSEAYVPESFWDTTLASSATQSNHGSPPQHTVPWDGRFGEIAANMSVGMREDFMPLLASLGFQNQTDALLTSLDNNQRDWLVEPPLAELPLFHDSLSPTSPLGPPLQFPHDFHPPIPTPTLEPSSTNTVQPNIDVNNSSTSILVNSGFLSFDDMMVESQPFPSIH